MQKFCDNCGAELKENSDVCLKCGKYVSKTGNNENVVENNKLALAGFIVSIISCILPFAGIIGMIGAILSGIGLFQITNGNEKRKGLAIAGLIIGILRVIYGFYIIINLNNSFNELMIFF